MSKLPIKTKIPIKMKDRFRILSFIIISIKAVSCN